MQLFLYCFSYRKPLKISYNPITEKLFGHLREFRFLVTEYRRLISVGNLETLFTPWLQTLYTKK
jgi:hypothetical protein